MRHFSFRPTLSLRGRTFKGLRGWSGKPFHPPLTDLPVTAYLLAAGLDVLSVAGGDQRPWARECWHVGTFVFTAGVGGAVLAALTGFWDARTSSQAGTQARRTINAHALFMVTSTVLALVDLPWRLATYHTATVAPVGVLVLSVLVAAAVAVGATFGGTLVYDYGFNVETAGDHPAWHAAEVDVFHGG